MSKISLEPNASGAGTFTLAAPNSNTNRTLTLPDESGAIFSDGTGVPGSAVTGQLASSNMPAGSVIQVLNTTPLTTRVTTTSDAELWSKTVTPLSNNSVFYIFSSWNTRNPVGIAAHVNGELLVNAAGRNDGTDGLVQEFTAHNQQSFHWKYENSSTNPVTFSERIVTVGGALAEVWDYGYMFSIIMEFSK